ncbi:hypothetical protein KOI35_02795 [Actinoplanes bogorensis]|uniref:NurA domain-containing protein n=1 Tax=Paractinoplanes bogorensis TaxID=1610840 RepID=A0ABS5YGG3_9ACTN|nr:hypothetical protein [Actinoplanes bogorensis]MBU2662431.1 hypothetical protein [Actinoplanes bogorensis]
MRVFVEPWDPSYGASFEGGGSGDGPASTSSAQIDTDVEVPAAEWAPIDVSDSVQPPDVVYLVDGVRRIDAGLSTAEDDGTSYAGLAASFAAGVVRCDLGRGVAELVTAKVGRGLFTASPSMEDLLAGPVRYEVHRIEGPGEASKLPVAVQRPLTALEILISSEARAHGPEGYDLLVVDGPLRARRQLPRTIGFIKTQEKLYLPAVLNLVVTRLTAGQRTPVFHLGTAWGGWTWYLRLPGGSSAPWSGIVRVECSPDLSPEMAIELADLSQATLPRFASSAYKDPRAPQNLVPIAGLERRLRGMLGDSRLLHRALTKATVRSR